MEKLFFTMEACDFRVHTFLTKALANTAAGSGCDFCIRNAALQMAFCHAIGFGMNHEEDQKSQCLMPNDRTVLEVEEALGRIRNDDKKSDVIMAQLAQKGYRHDFPTVYARDGVLHDAIKYYRAAVRKREALFKLGHFSTRRLQGLLITLLIQNDQFEEAMEIALKMDQTATEMNLMDRIEIKQVLVRLHGHLDNLDAAVDLATEVRAMYATLPEHEKTTERLDNQHQLAKILVQQGNLDEAILLAKETFEHCFTELGDLHATTIAIQRLLAKAYGSHGQIEVAVETNKKLVQVGQRLISEGNIDPLLVQDISRLGILCYRTNQLEAATNYYEQVLDLIRRDIRLAKHAVNAVNNAATERVREGDNQLAVVILQALLVETTRILGPRCQEAALVMGNLAWIYAEQENYDQAVKLERRVVGIRRTVLGPSHQDTVAALSHLRQTLLAQGNCEDAAAIGHEELKALAERAGSCFEDNVAAAETIADALYTAGAFTQALFFFEHEWRATTAREAREMSRISLPSMARAALCHFHLGSPHQAKALTISLLRRVAQGQASRRLEHDDFALTLVSLAKRSLELEWFDVSEQVLAVTLLLARQRGSLMPETLVAEVGSLISQYLELRNFDEFQVVFDPSTLTS
jgi:tetratricopeptide (TPR) repeat protein